MRRFGKNTFGLCALLAFASCRIASVGTSTQDPSPNESENYSNSANGSRAPIVQPQRQANTIVETLKVNFDANGQVREVLNLRLDYFAAPKSGAISVATCYDDLVESLVVGRALCDANAALMKDVKVSQINQICFTQSGTPKVNAKEKLTLKDCSGSGVVQIFKFSPEVKVEALLDEDSTSSNH